MLLSNRSYSLLRVNCLDDEEYSFEYLVPLVPLERARLMAARERAEAGEGQAHSLFEAIAEQCEAAGRLYGLSARENEVLAELARGRTIASIAEDLVVSENTVKAHTKAVCRKLGVHTREELLQRVEAVQGGTEGWNSLAPTRPRPVSRKISEGTQFLLANRLGYR